MRYTRELEYDAPPEQVYAMLTDSAFRERVCRAQQASACSVRVDPGAAGATLVLEQRRSTHGLPAFAGKLLGEQIRIVQREEWESCSAGALEVTIPGKPARLRATMTLNGETVRTVQSVSGDLTVSVPLLGGKLERLVADVFDGALGKQQEVASAWLAGER